MIPASICALKFDKNSYRQLCQLLMTADLGEYCGIYCLRAIFKSHSRNGYYISNVELFLTNEVDLAMFTTLGDEDLKSIGVLSYRARRLMLNAIGGKF